MKRPALLALLGALLPFACATGDEARAPFESASDAGGLDEPSFVVTTSTACEAAANGASAVGCDYYVFEPHFQGGAADPTSGCYAAFVVNVSSEAAALAVSRDGKTYDPSLFSYVPVGTGAGLQYQRLKTNRLDPGQVAILFLAAEPYTPDNFSNPSAPCPLGVAAAIPLDVSERGSAINPAFHLQTSAPVVAYDMLPFGGGNSAVASATLLLPTSVWGKSYVLAGPTEGQDYYSHAWAAVVAKENDTVVHIKAAVDIVAGSGMPAIAKGETGTITLQAGQYAQLLQTADLSGSIVTSDKPVAAFGGVTCMNIPVGEVACDAAHQQLPPSTALGWEYVVVKPRDRWTESPETPPFRIVGAVDGTTLTYAPAAPPGAPLTLSAGQVADFKSAAPFVVRSQGKGFPFFVAEYMEGCSVYGAGTGDCRGDPEFVALYPTAQYAKSYTFFTDPTYPETNLVIVRARGDQGFSSVALDCAGDLSGWQPLGDHEFTRLDLSTGNFQGVGGCDNGTHTIRSDAPFGVMVWGWGSAITGGSTFEPFGAQQYSQAVSYAYPAGANVQLINDVILK